MSINIASLKNIQAWEVWYFRFKKFNESSYLITNDAWKFHFLSINEFQELISWDVSKLEQYDVLVRKWFIKDSDYEAKMIWSVALKNHFVGLWPTLHMIVITLRCNHKCRYCHAAVAPMSAKEFDMSQETAKKVVDTIMYTNSSSFTIEFQWWEALVNYPVVQYVVEYANDRAQHLWKKVAFSLVSNLTLMTEEKLTWLLDNWVDICTSLDGDEISHNNSRTGYDGNSFERVSYWMQRVSSEKQKRWLGKIGALLTATKETLPRYKQIIDEYLKLGLDGIFLRWLNPYGFAAADMDRLAYESDDWIKFYRESLDYIIEINRSWTFFREQITWVYLQKIFDEYDPAFMDIRSPSWIAVGGVAYNYDGKVYASDESRMLGRMWMDDFLMTEIQETWAETYKAMMQSDIVKIAVQSSTLDGLPWYNDHVYKPYLWVDIIHNFKTTGSLYNPLVKDEKMKLQVAILDTIFEKLQDPESTKVMMSWIGK